MDLKWEIAKAVLASRMPPPMRLIMLVFLDGAGLDGVIPDRFTPSLTDLVNRTGLGRGTVADRLNDLESGGWVKRDRPSTAEARSGVKTRYALAVGDPEAGVKPKKDVSVPPESSSPGAGLVREPDQDTAAPSPGAGLALVREPDGGSPGAGPDLVREPDGKDTHLPTTTHQDQSSLGEPTLPIVVETPAAPKKRHRRPYGNADFDAFWEAYPRKDDPKKAWGVWQTAVKAADDRPALIADIIAGAQRYRDDPNRAEQFTKLATTWLNAASWENGPLPPRSRPNAHQPYQDPDRADYHTGSI